VVEKLYNYTIDFNEWMLFAFPFTVVLMAIAWFYLVNFGNPLPKKFQLAEAKSVIQEQQDRLSKNQKDLEAAYARWEALEALQQEIAG
jgi:sodium-dependent dicarboxylate transporter 2/3/5